MSFLAVGRSVDAGMVYRHLHKHMYAQAPRLAQVG